MEKFDLQHASLFAGLNGCELTALLGQARQKAVARGQAFFHEQDAARHCHLLVSGRVKLVQTNIDGGQVVVRFIGAGELFGWATVLGSPCYPGSAKAITACAALIWDAEEIRQAMQAHPRLALNALELIGGRLREAQDRLRELATERAEWRLARALLRLVRQSGRKTRDGWEINFPLSRQDLAEAVGTTLHTVSRILAAWTQAGIIGGGRQRLVVLQQDRLMALLDGSETV